MTRICCARLVRANRVTSAVGGLALAVSISSSVGAEARAAGNSGDNLVPLEGSFLQPTTAYWGSPVEPMNHLSGRLVGAADINLYFPFRTQLRETALRHRSGWTWDWTVLGAMELNLRQYWEESNTNEVSTPGYRPELRARIYGLYRRPASALLFMLEGGVGHYSNGQGGCFFRSPTRREPGCDNSYSSELDPATVDRHKGSFGNAAHSTAAMGIELSGLSEGEVVRQLSLRAEHQHHIFAPEWAARFYGSEQLVGDVAMMIRDPKHWQAQLRVRAQTSPTRVEGAPRSSLRLEFSVTSVALHGFGAFVGAHFGSDPLNIHFVDSIRQLQVGMIVNWLPLRFAREETEAAAAQPAVPAGGARSRRAPPYARRPNRATLSR